MQRIDKQPPSIDLARSGAALTDSEHSYRYEFTAQPKIRKPTSDLDALSSAKAEAVAEGLADIVEDLDFCELSRLIRCDHCSSPITNSSRNFIVEDVEYLRGRHLTEREADAARFFLLGESLPRDKASRVFGESNSQLIEEALSLELLRELPDGSVALNDLILCAHDLKDGQVVYFLADTPEYLESNIGEQRVYSGADSYFLNAKLQSYQSISGAVAEMGSGSGFQLVTLLKLHPDIDKAIGVEIDARARNVSVFNAMLNGESERFSVVESGSELTGKLGDAQLTLGFSNPPFIPVPRQVQAFDANEERAVSIDLREFFPKAGWGGHDGLRITRQFVDSLSPHLSPSGEIVIFSQFTGNKDEPVQVHQMAEEAGAGSSSFESFPRAQGYDLTSSEWASYVSRLTCSQNPELPEQASAWLHGATFDMLQKQGITNLHSGFVTLRAGDEPSITADRPDEQALQLYNQRRGSTALLRSLEAVIPTEDVRQPPGYGGELYRPSQVETEPSNFAGERPVFRRKLAGEGEAHTLSVYNGGGAFVFEVTNSQSMVVESGQVDAEASGRYRELLASIEVVDPLRHLRSAKVDGARVVSASKVNDILATHFSGDLLIEGIPSSNILRIGIMASGDERSSHVEEPRVLARYPMGSREGLLLNQLAQDESPHWKL